jgi:hypothetical protein
MARAEAMIALRRLAALALLVACDAAEVPRGATALDSSPQACARCHEAVAQQWASSLHAHAWDDPLFRREYDGNPAASCRDCHAPPTSAPGRTTGVDCATCHVRDGEVLAVHVTDAGTRAHPMRHEPRLQTAEHCGECHQFAFDDDGIHDPSEALQNTLVEYRGSDAHARGETCQSCHMRATQTGDDAFAGHAFPGLDDPEQLARAVDVDVQAQRSGGSVDVDVRITGADIGHAFPTGDVFRSAVLRVATPGGAQGEIVMQRWLAQTIDPDGEDLHVRTIDDTRVPAPGQGELRERLRLDDAVATELEWELLLWRVPPEHRTARGMDPAELVRVVSRGRARISG